MFLTVRPKDAWPKGFDSSVVAPSSLHKARAFLWYAKLFPSQSFYENHTFFTTACAILSQSITGMPSRSIIDDTVLFPVEIPPERPTSFIAEPAQLSSDGPNLCQRAMRW